MKRTLALLLTLLAFMNQSPAATWEELPPLPEPNGGCMAGGVHGKIIVAGGTNWRDDVKRWLNQVWILDAATRQWSAGPSLPHPLAYAGFASDGNRLYFAGGADGEKGRKEVYALDADLRLTRIGELPHPVVFAGAALHGDRLFLLGGTPDPQDWGSVTSEFHAVNLAAGKTTRLAPLETLRHGVGLPAVTATSGGLYTFTGAWLDPANHQVGNVADAFVFDRAKNLWRNLASYPQAARGVVSVALDDHRIYLAGGYGTDEQGFLATGFIFDTNTGRYTPATPLPFAATTCLVKCGGFIYVIGGEDKKKHRTAACWRIGASDLIVK